MSLRRSIKRAAAERPPLSALDKFIYICLSWGWIFAGLIIYLFGFSELGYIIACAKDSVVAVDNPEIIYFSLPFACFLILAPAMIAQNGMKKRQPIFGKREYKSSFLKPTSKVYPLFSRAFRESLSWETKRKIKKMAVLLTVIFLICAMILPFGLFTREVLDAENEIHKYNCFNQQIHSCNVADAERLVIEIVRSHTRKSGWSWRIDMNFVFQDTTYSFSLADFYKMSDRETLEYMLYLKSHFDVSQYEILHTDQVTNLINYQNYDAAETALLYELLDYQP